MAEQQPGLPIQMFGGIGSVALAHPDTKFDFEDKTVIAPGDLALSQFRDDGNKRDVDVLVLDDDSEVIKRVEQIAIDIIGDELEISVFGLKKASQLEYQTKHPYLATLKTFLSDRYDDKKALFPFSVPLGDSTLETWTLKVGDAEMPISHPGATLLNYLTRSISGLRPKDAEKLEKMAVNVFTKCPEVIEWIEHGDGAGQLELASILDHLRRPFSNLSGLKVGNEIELPLYNHDELIDHPAFMMPSASDFTKSAVLKAARLKSRVLHIVESNPRIVTMWQRFAESHAELFVKNNEISDTKHSRR